VKSNYILYTIFMEHNINCQFIFKKRINILSLLIYNKSKRNN